MLLGEQPKSLHDSAPAWFQDDSSWFEAEVWSEEFGSRVESEVGVGSDHDLSSHTFEVDVSLCDSIAWWITSEPVRLMARGERTGTKKPHGKSEHHHP